MFTIGKVEGFVKGWGKMMKEVSRSGSRWLLGMGLVLAVAGGVFTWVLWTSYQRAEVTRRWPEVPARVLSSQVGREQATPNSPTKFLVQVRYEYQWQGQRYESGRFRRVDGPMSDEDKALQIRETYTPGAQITCWVNPQEPAFAILKHETRAGLYSIWFPLLFVAGGLKMAWDAVRKMR